MRRIVVSVRPNGDSYVSSDEELPDSGRLWLHDPQDTQAWVDAIDPERVLASVQPSPRGALWAVGRIPAGGKPAGRNSGDHAQVDERGFHVTQTVDFIYVLDDGLVMDVNEGSVELSAGDAVVLQAANHAWRNTSDHDVRFLDVLVSAQP